MKTLQADDFELGMKIMALQEPEGHTLGVDGGVATYTIRSYFSEFIWQIVAVDLPFIVIEPWNPPIRWKHLKTFALDTRIYRFGLVSNQFAAALADQRIDNDPLPKR